MAGQPGLFDLDERYRALSESGDPLIRLATLIDFEVFRAPLVSALKRSDGTRGGRPSYDPVLMFKVVVLQTLYTLSDDATEFQIRDRLSFMRFLGLGLEHPVPDAKTVWLFREQLTRARAIEGLFATFDAALKAEGYLAMSGPIVDASIVVCPKQRNTDAEQQAIQAGHIPEGWQDQPKRLAGPAQEAGRTSPRGWQDQPKRLAGPAQEAGRTSPRGWQDQPKRLAGPAQEAGRPSPRGWQDQPKRLAGPAQEAGRTSPRGWQDQPKRLAGPAQEAGRTSPRGWQDQPKRLAGPAQEAGRTSPRGWQDQPKRLAGPAQEAGRTSPRGWQDQPKRLA